MTVLQTAEEFRDFFGIQEHQDYEDFTPFKDGKVGFSIKRPYPNDIPFRPLLKKDGTQDTLAMIRVLYNPKNQPESDLDLTKVPIWIDIGKHSKYQYNHFGFNFDDNDCPTKESMEYSKASPNPGGLTYTDEFFFDHTHVYFVDKKGQPYPGSEILQSVFDQHCDTTRKPRQRLWKSVAGFGSVCNGLIAMLEYVLRISFRKRFDKVRNPFYRYSKDDIFLLEAESLKIFGYETTKNVIVTFAAFVLVGYTISYFTCLRETAFLVSIWKNPFLVLCSTLVVLPLLEHQVPNLIRIAVNGLRVMHFWSIMHSPLHSEETSKKKTRTRLSNKTNSADAKKAAVRHEV